MEGDKVFVNCSLRVRHKISFVLKNSFVLKKAISMQISRIQRLLECVAKFQISNYLKSFNLCV